MERVALYFLVWSAVIIIVLARTSPVRTRAITDFFRVFFSWIPITELIKSLQELNNRLTFLLVLVALLLGALLSSFFF
jgi:hypothetical protein